MTLRLRPRESYVATHNASRVHWTIRQQLPGAHRSYGCVRPDSVCKWAGHAGRLAMRERTPDSTKNTIIAGTKGIKVRHVKLQVREDEVG